MEAELYISFWGVIFTPGIAHIFMLSETIMVACATILTVLSINNHRAFNKAGLGICGILFCCAIVCFILTLFEMHQANKYSIPLIILECTVSAFLILYCIEQYKKYKKTEIKKKLKKFNYKKEEKDNDDRRNNS